MSEDLVHGDWDPTRVLPALGKMGYEPHSAILDIVDNSISFDATAVAISLTTEKEAREGPGRRRTLVTSIDILDNGAGMSESGLHNALRLGSSTEGYRPNGLSKFGMGLKSASSSLGRRLELISRPSEDNPIVRKAVLDHDKIYETGQYVYSLTEPDPAEVETLDNLANNGSGTLVRLSKIHHDNMPTPASIADELLSRIGVVYYYHLAGVRDFQLVSISLNGTQVDPIDPLFETEAAGDLDEHNWDGQSVKYINRRQAIQLAYDTPVYAYVTMTQLPHPPSVAHASDRSQRDIRNQYHIGAGNYGFYIYRNGRLISWADSVGMVPQDQDLYSFRGRLEITSDADEILNLDVAKSRIKLSSLAEDQVRGLLTESIKKSRSAWRNAWSNIQRAIGSTPHDSINEGLDRVAELEEKEQEYEEEASPPEERERLKERRTEALQGRQATKEESERLRQTGERVQYVASLADNQLWERAHDPSQGLIVRVNTSHRLYRELVQDEIQNESLVRLFDLLMFSLAHAEYQSIYLSELPSDTVEKVLADYRERAGNDMSEIIRKIFA